MQALILHRSTKRSSADYIRYALFSFRHLTKLILFAFLIYLQALSKGISDTLSGWIFGTQPFVQFLISPIFGKLVSFDLLLNMKSCFHDIKKNQEAWQQGDPLFEHKDSATTE